MNGLLIAAQGSGAGKTAAALGLIAALRARGHAARAAKSGPDFIDAGWLAKASGQPCLNLDAWMLPDHERLKRMAADFARDAFLVVEGAMGLHDGGGNGEGSCAELADVLNLPVLLLLDAKGMGQTCAALAHGLLSYAPPGRRRPRFCGVVCAKSGSARHERMLSEALAPVCAASGAPLLGFLAAKGAPAIPSRHLGLAQACELELDLEAAGRWLEAGCDVDAIISACHAAAPACDAPRLAPGPAHGKAHVPADRPVIAIARDAAFSFCYADLPPMLERLGARIAWFSPLADAAPPPCDGIYLPGGYPELHARQLAENTAMRQSLRALARAGLPIYGECGGYIYLMQALAGGDGRAWPMCGILPGQARLGEARAALGYRKAAPLWLGGGEIRGHEFHYASKYGEARGQPLWQAWDSAGQSLGTQGQRLGNAAGAWIHLYPEASRSFWSEWLELCLRMHRERPY